MTLHNNQRLQNARQFWDNEADSFDDEPDHGLCDPIIRTAWTELISEWLPPNPASILDIGCGTGSLSLVLASLEYEVTGIDLSKAMIARAEVKSRAAGCPISFKVMDAYAPQLANTYFDVIVCRHLLWAMPSVATALRRWSKLLVPEGRMLLIEGFWYTGSGLHSEQVVEALPAAFTTVNVRNLSANEALWGQEKHDERYIVIAESVAG